MAERAPPEEEGPWGASTSSLSLSHLRSAALGLTPTYHDTLPTPEAQGERGFCAFYRKLEEQSAGQDVVRLFERGAGTYYSLHGKDARFVADTVYQTTTILKYLGGCC